MDRRRCYNEIFDLPSWYSHMKTVHNSLICTEIDVDNGYGVICDGDSGSPMMVKRFVGSYTFLGIAAFGTSKNCSEPGEAAVYTNVYYYLPWMRTYVDLTYV
eukprot:sb/3478408/